MREAELLIKVLRETSQYESGVIMMVKPYDENVIHHVSLLIDAKLGVERPNVSMEMTNAGYDFLSALEANPHMEKMWVDLLNNGATLAGACRKVTEDVNTGLGI